MGIEGSVTSVVTATSVTLPATKIQVIGATVHTADVSGHLQIPINSSRNAIFPFRATTATTTATAGGKFNRNEWHFNLTTDGNVLNFTGTGLTNGTFVFYYGTPFPDAKPLNAFAGVVTSYTTGATVTMTFPAGDLQLTGIINIIGSDAGQTNLYVIDSWASASGKTITIPFANGEPMEIKPLTNVTAAASLVVTQTYDGTHVATGYLIFYYQL